MVFIPTFFFVSVTPGMCMTLALSLGMTVGVRRTLWMMVGELVGVGLVACLAVVGVAAVMLQYPQLFQLLRNEFRQGGTSGSRNRTDIGKTIILAPIGRRKRDWPPYRPDA